MKLFKRDRSITKKPAEEVKELFIGRKTVFTLMGSIVGAIFFGSSLWVISVDYLGHTWTMIAGLLIFTMSGMMSHQFQK